MAKHLGVTAKWPSEPCDIPLSPGSQPPIRVLEDPMEDSNST